MKQRIILFACAAMLWACDDEPKTISDNPTPASLSSHANGSAIVIDASTISGNVTFEWQPANYGIETVTDYEVEVDKGGNNFGNAIVLGSTRETKLTIGLESLNTKLLEDLDVTPNVASPIDFRIVSTVNGAHEAVSSSLTLQVTAYVEVLPPPAKLWVPGGYQSSGGDPSQGDALTIYAVAGSNDEVFEGYITIPSPTWIKFTSAPDWGHINYGSTGSGSLTADGNAPGIDVPEAGYYKVIVNTDNMTFLLAKIDTWGLIGTATPGNWDTSSPMEYHAATKTWTKTMALVNGALKFRANNGWDINYGPADSDAYDGNLVQTDASISIAEAGTYTVTIDLTRSQSPYVYTYTVVKN